MQHGTWSTMSPTSKVATLLKIMFGSMIQGVVAGLGLVAILVIIAVAIG